MLACSLCCSTDWCDFSPSFLFYMRSGDTEWVLCVYFRAVSHRTTVQGKVIDSLLVIGTIALLLHNVTGLNFECVDWCAACRLVLWLWYMSNLASLQKSVSVVCEYCWSALATTLVLFSYVPVLPCVRLKQWPAQTSSSFSSLKPPAQARTRSFASAPRYARFSLSPSIYRSLSCSLSLPSFLSLF